LARDVMLRKLTFLHKLLSDLAPLCGSNMAQVMAEHYKLERLLELLVMTASDLLFHLLAEQGVNPDSYRAAFRQAGELGLLPIDLASRLQAAAGMRNILVHQYEDVDYIILHDSIEPALHDFAQFAALLTTRFEQVSADNDAG